MKWKIFYIDGSTFSNIDGNPEDAPGGGVLAVAEEDPTVGVLIHERNAYYVFDKQFNGWYGIDHEGFIQYLLHPGFKIIKLAESMSTNAYKILIQRIRNDPDLPNKSARYPWEHRF